MAAPPPPYGLESNVDFRELSMVDRDFANLLGENGRFDWHNAQHVKQLTIAVLKKDFNLRLELPDDRLCPRVPVRYNYVCWMRDILTSTNPSYSDAPDAARSIRGLDVGVGASNIYSLLCLRTNPSWRMYGTDVDEVSLKHAENNASLNNFSDRMQLRLVSRQDPLLPLDQLSITQLDFTICNPPFFASVQEMEASLAGSGKETGPRSVCVGTESEMVTEGGDYGFVRRMVEESKLLRERVRWYSSMLGKFDSLKRIVALLKDEGVTNWAVCSLAAEQAKTNRWAVAWSWADYRPSNEILRRDVHGKDLAPFPTLYGMPLDVNEREDPSYLAEIAASLNEFISGLDLKWDWNPTRMEGIGLARKNVWSRAARRRKRRREDESADEMLTEPRVDPASDIALVFKLVLTDEQASLLWLRGSDQVLWESFCGALHRRLRSVTEDL